MSVRNLLWAAFSTIVLLVVMAIAFSLFQMSTINGSTKLIFEREYIAGQAAEQVRGLIYLASRSQAQLLTATTAFERDKLGQEISKSLSEIDKRLKVVRDLANTEEMQATTHQIDDQISRWGKDLKDYVEHVKSQPIDLVQMSADIPIEDATLLNKANKLGSLIDAVVEQRAKSAQATMEAADGVYTSSLRWMVFAMVSIFLAALAISLAVTKRLHTQLGGEPIYAKEISAAIAEGNLSRDIDVTKADERSLMYSLKTMQDNLCRLVLDVRSTSQHVALASYEIEHGNHDLSARTESQASNLEEASASMEELGVSINHNAQGISQVDHLAYNASGIARQGQSVFAEVVETMSEINYSSKKIFEIINVIDAIAFQTNILALNAAVEAARAGENGRGFAVVASEVRSLAGRSATAAKEIKALITTSVERVEQGTMLVGKAGLTMTEIVASIDNVSNLMRDIRASSDEQASAVSQMEEAVKHIDQTTQQNAALVEQMAAAASSLKSQADDLVNTVMQFKLPTSTQLSLL